MPQMNEEVLQKSSEPPYQDFWHFVLKLKALAKKSLPDFNDFNAMDASGGNFDDAYDLGMKHGEIMLAQEILEMLKIDYK
jgi:hypothetical protein